MKNLFSKLLAGAFIAGTLAGCSAREFVKGEIYDVKYGNMTQDAVPYKLEEQVIYQNREFFEETNQLPDCLKIAIKKYDDVVRQINLNSGEVILKSDAVYIPKRVWNQKKNRWANKITLRTDGLYKTKASMTKENESETKISENEFAYNFLTTEEDASFGLPTAKILGKKYFVVYVEDKEVNQKGKLNYYLIPEEGAKIDIKDSCGNLYIEGEIYRGLNPNIFPNLFQN